MNNFHIIGKGQLIDHLVTCIKKEFPQSEIYFYEDMSKGRGEASRMKTDFSRRIATHNTKELEKNVLANYNKDDYLLSFDNFLKIPKKLCIYFHNKGANFHPAPLPCYQGINPISWGLYNREKNWGITWHCIEEDIDKGNVITRSTFELNEDDDVSSLSTRCYMGAIKSFPKVLLFLKTASLVPTPFNLDLIETPKYYSFSDVPQIDLSEKNINDALKFMPRSPYSRWRWVALYNQVKIDYISLGPQAGQYHDLNLKKIKIGNKEFFVNYVEAKFN